MMNSTNVAWHHATVTRQRREALNKHRGAIIWFTGLSGAGKSTLAHAVEEALHRQGCRTFVLDGDNVRHGLCGDLGFSHEDRNENIRRIGEVSKLMLEAGVIVLTAFISPYQQERRQVRNMVKQGDFIEIYCDSPIEICEQRDVKGHYKKARAGQIKEFTGISSPYEKPENAELVVNTGTASLDECVAQVTGKIWQHDNPSCLRVKQGSQLSIEASKIDGRGSNYGRRHNLLSSTQAADHPDDPCPA